MFDYIYRWLDLVDSKEKTPFILWKKKKIRMTADIHLTDIIIVVIMELVTKHGEKIIFVLPPLFAISLLKT